MGDVQHKGQEAMSDYGLPYVFWGRALPKISVYTSGILLDQWQFSKHDNFRMAIKCQRTLDSEEEMEDGTFRQRIRGYRLFVTFSISMVKNRAMLMFLRNMFLAEQIILTPHYGSMQSPIDNTYQFSMIVDSDFEPEYFDGRFIGHSIEFTLKSLTLLPSIPRDNNLVQVIPAETMKVGGVVLPDRKYVVTYWGEKMYYGGWELTPEDFKYVAFWEQPEDPGEIDPYGKLWT
jgi:hypothetical protein